MIRYRHGLLFAIVALSGCQTMSGLFQNRFASTPEFTTGEMAALSQPLSEATSPELGGGIMTAGAGGQTANPVSQASYNQANTAQQAGPNSAQSLVEAGQQAIRDAGQNNPAGLQQARQLFQQALRMDSGNADAHHGIAIVADLQKDWMAAEQHYKQALSGDPSNPSLLNDLGYSYLLQSRYHESQQYLNQAIQISPKHERAHLNLALLSLRRGNATAARQTLAQIYSQQEIGSNLARLQQDLMKLNAESGGMGAGYPGGPASSNNNGMMTAELPQNGGNAIYQASQAQPSDWNANRPPSQNYGQLPMASQDFPAAGGVQRFNDAGGSMAIDPALRVDESRPVSLYPPGVVREEVTAGQASQQNLGFSPGQPMPQNGAQAMANSGNPNQQFGNPQLGNAQFGNGPSNGQSAYQPFQAGSMNVQMPGANNASNMMNQYPVVNSGPAANSFNANAGGGMNTQGGFGAPAMGLNFGPGMPFPVGGAAGMNRQQGQFNPQSQNTAQPLLNQYDAGAMGMQGAGFGSANSGQGNFGQPNLAQEGYGQANYGQLPPRPSVFSSNGQGQREISQLPAHRQPLGEVPNSQFSAGQMNNTQPVSYGQPVGSPAGFGQANYGQPNSGQSPGLQNQMPGQFPGTFNAGAIQPSGMNGQAMYPHGQSQHFGQGMNPGAGSVPAGMPQGMNNQFNGSVQQGMQGGPMQQFEQQQMNRINDQYQQALQQMNGRGFPGQ